TRTRLREPRLADHELRLWLRQRGRPGTWWSNHRHYDRRSLRAKRPLGAGNWTVPWLPRRECQWRTETGRQRQRGVDAGSDRAASLRGTRNLGREGVCTLERRGCESLGERSGNRKALRLS